MSLLCWDLLGTCPGCWNSPQRIHSHYNLALHNNNKCSNCLQNQIMQQTMAPGQQSPFKEIFLLSENRLRNSFAVRWEAQTFHRLLRFFGWKEVLWGGRWCKVSRNSSRLKFQQEIEKISFGRRFFLIPPPDMLMPSITSDCVSSKMSFIKFHNSSERIFYSLSSLSSFWNPFESFNAVDFAFERFQMHLRVNEIRFFRLLQPRFDLHRSSCTPIQNKYLILMLEPRLMIRSPIAQSW